MSEAMKKAKAKYYQKLKETNPEFMIKNKEKAKEYYDNNKLKHNESCKRYYEANKDQISEQIKVKRTQQKLDSVVSQLEQMDKFHLAKILIQARKTGLLNIQ